MPPFFPAGEDRPGAYVIARSGSDEAISMFGKRLLRFARNDNFAVIYETGL